MDLVLVLKIFFMMSCIVGIYVILRNLDIIIDIGAHEGEMQSFFLKNFNVKKIISFEASEINFLKLKKKVEYNKGKFIN